MSARTAVETIEDAIKRVNNLQSILGLMEVGEDPTQLYARVETDEDVDGAPVATGLDLTGVDSDEEINEAIVTLRRTVDAQLAILADGLIVAKHWEDILEQVSGTMRTPIDHALLIARAILGESS